MQNLGVKVNSYFLPNTQKPSPLKQTFIIEQRSRAQSSQKQKANQTRLGGRRQISPDCGRICSEARTPINNGPLKMDRSFNLLNIDEKVKKEESFIQLPSTQQMKKSPSYRLKSFKRPQSKQIEEKQTLLQYFSSNKKFIKRDSVKSRITNLENFVYQLQEKNEIQQLQTEEIPRNSIIKKTIQAAQNNISSQSTQITILDDQENNIEELHFLLVQFQQKCKQCTRKIDKKTEKVF